MAFLALKLNLLNKEFHYAYFMSAMLIFPYSHQELWQ